MGRTFKAVMLHGFLGSGSDWGLVRRELERRGIETDILAPDFFSPGPLSAAFDFDQWLIHLREAVAERFGDERVHLLGYSLGGRMALHAALNQPARWKSLWIFSSNPGVFPGGIEERRQWESATARKFLELPWEELMREWNQEAVFNQTTPRLVPREGTLRRDLLANSFSAWSVTRHRFAVADLAHLPMPVEWWFGEHDLKYLDVKREMERQNVKGRYRVIEGAGHRILLDRPDSVAAALAEIPGEDA